MSFCSIIPFSKEGRSTSEKLTELQSENKALVEKSNALEKEMKTLKSTIEVI